MPNVEIEGISGSEFEELRSNIMQICVEESLEHPDTFTIIIRNAFVSNSPNEPLHYWLSHEALAVGRRVKIGFRRATLNDPAFAQDYENPCLLEGEITGVEVNYEDGHTAQVVVRGCDLSHRLHMGKHFRSFVNVTDGDIVNTIARENQLQMGDVDSTPVNKYVCQQNETDFDFLKQRAAMLGFECFMQDRKLHFRKPREQAALELVWRRDLHGFHVRRNVTQQVKSVSAAVYDPATKRSETTVYTRQDNGVLTKTGAGTGTEIVSGHYPMDINYHITHVNLSQNDQLAQGVLDRLSGDLVMADAVAEGDPRLRPGRIVNISGLGTNQNGTYYVTNTRHLYDTRKYVTEFTVRGGRGANLALPAVPNRPKLQPGQAHLVGIVTNNNDPDGMGRVRVKFPTLSEQHESDWARVVAPGAGNQRGFWCLPEVGDEVVVCFEQGDIHRPYVLGGVWNGSDAPPDSQGETVNPVHLRTFATRKGHRMTYADETAGGYKQGIHIISYKGYKIVIDEESDFLEVRTPGGHYLKMDDRGKSVTLHSTGSLTISASTIKIEATGSMQIDAASITQKGTGGININ
jgi:uncharacterized protein involved in type VI secretion and phage assembly